MALPEQRLRTMHLFAGAGGGILGDLILGHVPVCAVEIEEYPRKVLLARQRDGILPRFPIWDDIITFDGRPWRGRVDIVAGGFPCQDISAAGKGAGLAGARSGLWSEMARIVCEVGPHFVFVENSPLLVSRGLDVVLGDLLGELEDIDFDVMGFGEMGPFAIGENDADEEWQGMPEFEQEDKSGFRKIIVHFNDQAGVDEFAALVGQKLSDKTRYMWFPEAELDKTANLRYESES